MRVARNSFIKFSSGLLFPGGVCWLSRWKRQFAIRKFLISERDFSLFSSSNPACAVVGGVDAFSLPRQTLPLAGLDCSRPTGLESARGKTAGRFRARRAL